MDLSSYIDRMIERDCHRRVTSQIVAFTGAQDEGGDDFHRTNGFGLVMEAMLSRFRPLSALPWTIAVRAGTSLSRCFNYSSFRTGRWRIKMAKHGTAHSSGQGQLR